MKKLITILALMFIGCNMYAQAFSESLPWRAIYGLVPPPDTSLYDTLVVFNPNLFSTGALYVRDDTLAYFDLMYTYADTIESVMVFDPNKGQMVYPIDYWDIHYNEFYTTELYADIRCRYCDGGGNIRYGNPTFAWDPLGSNRFANAYAQPWHLDTNVIVCGMAAWIKDNAAYKANTVNYYYIMDTNFNVLTRDTLICLDRPFVVDTSMTPGIFMEDTLYYVTDFNTHYFRQHVNVKDFYIGVDVIGNITKLNYTCSITDTCLDRKLKELGLPGDTIFIGRWPNDYNNQFLYLPPGMRHYTYPSQLEVNPSYIVLDWTHQEIIDTFVLWQSPYPPAFRRDSTWQTFDNDTAKVLDLYQRSFIELLPIILIPKGTLGQWDGNLTDAYLQNNTWVYPNPTKDLLNITCGFKINRIELYDLNGKLLRDIHSIGDNKMRLPISNLEKGIYFIKISTSRGEITKKIIKQ